VAPGYDHFGEHSPNAADVADRQDIVRIPARGGQNGVSGNMVAEGLPLAPRIPKHCACGPPHAARDAVFRAGSRAGLRVRGVAIP